MQCCYQHPYNHYLLSIQSCDVVVIVDVSCCIHVIVDIIMQCCYYRRWYLAVFMYEYYLSSGRLIIICYSCNVDIRYKVYIISYGVVLALWSMQSPIQHRIMLYSCMVIIIVKDRCICEIVIYWSVDEYRLYHNMIRQFI